MSQELARAGRQKNASHRPQYTSIRVSFSVMLRVHRHSSGCYLSDLFIYLISYLCRPRWTAEVGQADGYIFFRHAAGLLLRSTAPTNFCFSFSFLLVAASRCGCSAVDGPDSLRIHTHTHRHSDADTRVRAT